MILCLPRTTPSAFKFHSTLYYIVVENSNTSTRTSPPLLWSINLSVLHIELYWTEAQKYVVSIFIWIIWLFPFFFLYLFYCFFGCSKIPAFLNVVDIAGLVKGAHAGQGLGNAFLSHINACDGIFHMTREYICAYTYKYIWDFVIRKS